MSYIINKTDGTVLTEVVDGSIDQTATDLTLVGKNATTYGEFLNENFVHILENFASTSAPNNPIQGQLWYDTSEGRLKIYDGSGFKVSGGTIVSNTIPILAQGDIWIDSYRQQLYFSVDGTTTMLAGPGYTLQQGVSGLQTIDVTDTNNIIQTVSLLYVGGSILGLFSKTSFTPATAIPEFSGDVKVGFNASTYSGVKFNVPVTQADALVADDGTLRTVGSFVSSTENSAMYGRLNILNDAPLILGGSSQSEIAVNNTKFQISSNKANQNFKINLLSNEGLLPSLHISAQEKFIGLYTDVPTATLDVNGDTRIRGNLLVEGATTTINTTNLAIEDLLVELGKVETPTNATAEGGGISLAGGVDGNKTLTWQGINNSWASSENIDLAAGNAYYVNGFPVINQTTLGNTVVSAPGLRSVSEDGLLSLIAGYISINNETIGYSRPGYSNGDVVIAPAGTGSVSVSNKKITNLADPVSNTDAVNLQYLRTQIEVNPVGLSINVGGRTNSQIVTDIIDKVYPASEHQDGAICKIWCIDTEKVKYFSLSGGVWAYVPPDL